MNFIDAQCVVEGAKAFLKFDKYQVELPEAKAKKLIDGGYAGKNVVFGIRPEDIYDSAEHLDKFATCKIDSDVTGYRVTWCRGIIILHSCRSKYVSKS